MNAVLMRAILCIVCWVGLAIAGNMAYAKNPRVREFVIDKKMAEQVTNLTGRRRVPCHIRFVDEKGSNLDDLDYFRNQFPIKMYCNSIDDLRFPRGSNVRFDTRKKTWVKDFSERSYADDPESYKKLDKASRIYTIQAKNSMGYVYTEDDLIGEESLRNRKMDFCLLHPPKALCGNAAVMRLSDPKSNVLLYVLKMLRSVEFIDDAPAAVSPALPGPETAQP